MYLRRENIFNATKALFLVGFAIIFGSYTVGFETCYYKQINFKYELIS